MILGKDLLLYIQRELLTKPTEVCGNIMEIEGRAVLVDVSEGTFDGVSKRPICKPIKVSRMYFHTHPVTSKAYPSSEDILTVMKRKKFQVEKYIVFTSWGIWVMSSRKKDDFSSQEKTALSLKKLDKILGQLFRNTQRGRLEITPENKETLFENIEIFVRQVSEEFRKFELSIEFYFWDIPEFHL